MEVLGHISFKEIRYCNVRSSANWFEQLPLGNWIAFTIANNEDDQFITTVVNKCLDNEVACICCAGDMAYEADEYFENEMVDRNIKQEQDEADDIENTTMITYHTNFSEGFWFASNIANASIATEHSDIDKVICIDMTGNGVRNHLRDLIGRFNAGELPSDTEVEDPLYDKESK